MMGGWPKSRDCVVGLHEECDPTVKMCLFPTHLEDYADFPQMSLCHCDCHKQEKS
jgi:hypothetical protein